jgi:hypothetical protein
LSLFSTKVSSFFNFLFFIQSPHSLTADLRLKADATYFFPFLRFRAHLLSQIVQALVRLKLKTNR